MKKFYTLLIACLLAGCASGKGPSVPPDKEAEYKVTEATWTEKITNFGIVSPNSRVTLSLECQSMSSLQTGTVKFYFGWVEYQYSDSVERSIEQFSWADRSNLTLKVHGFDTYYDNDGNVVADKLYVNESKSTQIYIEEIYDICLFFGPRFNQLSYDKELHCYGANSITLNIRNSNHSNSSSGSKSGEDEQYYQETIFFPKYYFHNNVLEKYTFSMYAKEGGSVGNYTVNLSDYETTQIDIPTTYNHTYLTNNYVAKEDYHYNPCVDYGYYHLEGNPEPHTYVNTVVEPDFEHQGYTEHKCSKCNHSYKDTYTPVKQHNYSEAWNHDSDYHWHQCIDEGYEGLTTEKIAHSFDTIQVIEPTFETEGYTKHICECGEFYIDNEKECKQHSYSSEWTYTDEIHYHVCTDEGYEILRSEEAAHTMGEWYTAIAPGETTKGVSERKCTVCDYTEQKSIKPTGSIDRLTFELNSDGESYTVYGKKEKIDEKPIYIPDEYNGLPVTIIGENAFSITPLSEIHIPDTITHIKNYAFSNTGLTSITFPNSVTSASSLCINDCRCLETIQLGDNINHYFRAVVNTLYSLKGIYVSDNNPLYKSFDGVVYSKDSTTLLLYPQARSEKQYNVSEGTTTIAANAFMYVGAAEGTEYENPNTQYLKSIKLPESLTTIEEKAFLNYRYESIYMPSGVENIGSEAFHYNVTIFVKYDIDLSRYAYNWYNGSTYIFIGESVGVDDGIFYPQVEAVLDWVMYDGAIYYLRNNQTAIYGHNPTKASTITIHNQIIYQGVTFNVTLVGAYQNLVGDKIRQVEYSPGQYYDVALPVGGSRDAHTTLPPFSGTRVEKVYVEEGIEIFSCYSSFDNSAAISELHLPHSLTVMASAYFQTGLINQIYYNGTIEEWTKVIAPNVPASSYPVIHCLDGDYQK